MPSTEWPLDEHIGAYPDSYHTAGFEQVGSGVQHQMMRFTLALLLLAGCAPAPVPSVVVARLDTQGGVFQCSGVPLNGLLLTAKHCTDVGPLYWDGRLLDAEPFHVGAEVVGLRLPWVQGHQVWGRRAMVGDVVGIDGYGCSVGGRTEKRWGLVKEVWWGLVFTDIPGCHGDSGGPLFDAQHRLIGVTTYIDERNQHLVASRVWPLE